jgi:hypothetical protein
MIISIFMIAVALAVFIRSELRTNELNELAPLPPRRPILETWTDSETGELRCRVWVGDGRSVGLETMSLPDVWRLCEYSRHDSEVKEALRVYFGARSAGAPHREPEDSQSEAAPLCEAGGGQSKSETQAESGGDQFEGVSRTEACAGQPGDQPMAEARGGQHERGRRKKRGGGPSGKEPRKKTGRRRSRRRSPVEGAMTEHYAYAILDLARGADEREIVKAHRTMIKKHHPDLGGSNEQAALINEARDLLLAKL